MHRIPAPITTTRLESVVGFESVADMFGRRVVIVSMERELITPAKRSRKMPLISFAFNMRVIN